MNDAALRRLLEQHITYTEPPFSLDAEAAIQDARRARIARRVALAAAGLTSTAALVTAVALLPQQQAATPTATPTASVKTSNMSQKPSKDAVTSLARLVGEHVEGRVFRMEDGSITVVPGVATSAEDSGVYGKFWLLEKGAAAATPVMVNLWPEEEAQPSIFACRPPKRLCGFAEAGPWQLVQFELNNGSARSDHVVAHNTEHDLTVAVATTDGDEFAMAHTPPGRSYYVVKQVAPVVDSPPLNFAELQDIATWTGWNAVLDRSVGSE